MKKKHKWTHLTISKKLIFSFLFIIIVPTLLIGIISYNNSKKEIEKNIEQGASENVKLLNGYLDDYISTFINDISFFSTRLNASSGSKNEQEATRKSFEQYMKLHPNAISVYLGTDSGDFVVHPFVKMEPDFDASTRPWYKDAKANKGEAIVTDPYVDATSGEILITVAKELSDGSGVVGIDLSLDALKKLAASIKIGEHGYPLILSSKGAYLVHPTEKIGSEAKETWVDTLLKEQDGNFSYENNGKDKSMFFDTNELTGMKIAGTMYLSEVDDASRPILISSLIIIVIFIAVGIAISLLITLSITRPLQRLVTVTERVSDGDLTQNFKITTNDEIGQVGIAFNRMIDSLRDLIRQVGDKSDQLASSSEELMASSEQNNKATEQVADSIQEVASGTESQTTKLRESNEIVRNMAHDIQQIKLNTQNVAHTSSEASNVVLNGEQAIQLSITQMNNINVNVQSLGQVIHSLGERSQEISQIANVISDIAAQTNLLALNAAIEAARAGEHGKGFAVVADEVRKLAEQSSKSTESIRQLITTIQAETENAVLSMDKGTKEVEKGIEVVHDAGTSFQQIQYFVDTVSSQIQEISASIQQMAQGTEKVVETVSEIEEIAIETTSQSQDVSAATEEQLASMEEIAASAASLANMAEELQDSIKKFRI
jgi:methyl-accepting chemotaxis protein